MKKLTLSLGLLVLFVSVSAQAPSSEANYQLASRYSPRKLDKMVFSTSVDPHWLKNSTRFWYSYETPNGKYWYIVDPAKAEKHVLFDNAKMAAQLTSIMKDPMDAQHLTIDSLRFVRDENWMQFQVTSTLDSVVKDTAAKKAAAAKTEKKKFYFEYNVNNPTSGVQPVPQGGLRSRRINKPLCLSRTIICFGWTKPITKRR
jgi:dipeptidyl-peptidase 4